MVLRKRGFMNKKGLIIAIVSALTAILLIGGVTGFIIFKKKTKDSYRVIKVSSMEGRSYVNRGDLTDLDTFEGMVLQSGDTVIVDGNSNLVLLLDNDKYCYIEENTELKLIAEGTDQKSRTKIEVIKGAVTVDVQNKLTDGSTFDVSTPNSTMAIRGTVVRIEVTLNSKGEIITKYSLFKGDIEIGATDAAGTVISSYSLTAGDEIIIGGTGNPKVGDIDFENLPLSAIESLIIISDTDPLDIISKSDLQSLAKDEELQGTFTVEFYYNDTLFATQEVKNGGKIVPPALSPATEGAWFADLTKSVDRNLKIYWR